MERDPAFVSELEEKVRAMSEETDLLAAKEFDLDEDDEDEGDEDEFDIRTLKETGDED